MLFSRRPLLTLLVKRCQTAGFLVDLEMPSMIHLLNPLLCVFISVKVIWGTPYTPSQLKTFIVLKKQKIHSRWYTTLATKGNTWKYNTPWQRKYRLVLYFWESQVQSWARVTVCADLHMFALWLHGFPSFLLLGYAKLPHRCEYVCEYVCAWCLAISSGVSCA